jgi:riboflavin kinase, archaea type
VFSGKGEGTMFITLPWVTKQIKEKLGFEPFPGTLNLKLTENSRKTREVLDRSSGIEILPALDYRRGKLFRAKLKKFDCAIVVPDVLDYPREIIEVIASENLRRRLQLTDGSKVEVQVLI